MSRMGELHQERFGTEGVEPRPCEECQLRAEQAREEQAREEAVLFFAIESVGEAPEQHRITRAFVSESDADAHLRQTVGPYWRDGETPVRIVPFSARRVAWSEVPA